MTNSDYLGSSVQDMRDALSQRPDGTVAAGDSTDHIATTEA